MSTINVARQPIGSVTRRPASGSLAEVVDIILDKGLVLDAYVRVALVGIELLTVEARVVIASVDTYLHFAEATNRLDIEGQAEERDATLMDLMSGMSEEKTEGAIDGATDQMREEAQGAKDRIKNVFGADDDDNDDS